VLTNVSTAQGRLRVPVRIWPAPADSKPPLRLPRPHCMLLNIRTVSQASELSPPLRASAQFCPQTSHNFTPGGALNVRKVL